MEVVTNEVNLDEVIAELFGLLKDKTINMKCHITTKSAEAREGVWKTINMKCHITGKSAEAREGVWSQGSRKEIS